MKCYECGNTKHHNWKLKKVEVEEDKFENHWFCGDCAYFAGPNYYSKNWVEGKNFKTNDNAWEADIKSRRVLPDGSVGRFTPDGKRYA